MASGGRHGFAQSLFQVGGNAGSAIGPLLAAFVVVPRGQRSVAWFSAAALAAMVILTRVGRWYQAHRDATKSRPAARARATTACPAPGGGRAGHAAGAGLLQERLPGEPQQLLHLLPDRAVRRLGPGGADLPLRLSRRRRGRARSSADRSATGSAASGSSGRRSSACCRSPSRCPTSSLFWTGVLSVVIGLILASAFSAILVFAQELVPGRIGMVSGLFFGFAFGTRGSGPPCWAIWPTAPGSSTCTGSVPICRRSDCSRRFFPTSKAGLAGGGPRRNRWKPRPCRWYRPAFARCLNAKCPIGLHFKPCGPRPHRWPCSRTPRRRPITFNTRVPP